MIAEGTRIKIKTGRKRLHFVWGYVSNTERTDGGYTLSIRPVPFQQKGYKMIKRLRKANP
jgi:hypothetical protein